MVRRSYGISLEWADVTFVGGPADGKEARIPRGLGRIQIPANVCDKGAHCDCHKPVVALYEFDLVGTEVRYVGTACGTCPDNCERVLDAKRAAKA